MPEKNPFAACHPWVGACYFALVLGFTMFLNHPACLAVSLAGAAGCSVNLRGAEHTGRTLARLAPAALLAALINPAFSHRGVTVLSYLPGGNPLTLESILAGAFAAGLLCAALLWFSCCMAVLSGDKFVFLFGRAAPALALVLSMVLRFLPRLRTRYDAVRQARRGVDPPAEGESLRGRVRREAGIWSILITWSLEDAAQTADSMKARGYGLPGRTAYTVWRMDGRDKGLLAWLIGAGAYVACGWAAGGFGWQFYPALRAAAVTPLSVSFFAVYLALCLTPVLFNTAEDKRWRRLQSGI